MRFLAGSTLFLIACSTTGSGGTAPRPEVEETQIKLDLPAAPEFVEPKPYPDGSHSVTEMRLKGPKFLEQQVKITGFVVFKYDLETCAREVGEKLVQKDAKLCEGKKDVIDCTQKVGQKSVADSPDQCDRPYFYLADAPNASFEKSISDRRGPAPAARRREARPAARRGVQEGPPGAAAFGGPEADRDRHVGDQVAAGLRQLRRAPGVRRVAAGVLESDTDTADTDTDSATATATATDTVTDTVTDTRPPTSDTPPPRPGT